MTRSDLMEKTKRRLGHPMIKVELDDIQILDHIDYARDKFIKWATGQANQEVFFTLMLSAGQHLYDLPNGVIEVVNYDTNASTGGINTLFTVENYLYNQGMLDALFSTEGRYTLMSYHIARDFLDTLNKYIVDAYNYKYHPYSNQLEIQPPPACGTLNIPPTYDCDGIEVDAGGIYRSPGWILLRTYMITESTIDNDNFDKDVNDFNFYGTGWVLDYVTALSKISLGIIRNKFANFTSIGNAGISLDGDSMISEGKEEKERLDESLKLEECYEGYSILIG